MTDGSSHDALIQSLAGELRPVRRLRSPYLRALVWVAAIGAAACVFAWLLGVGGIARRWADGLGESAEFIAAAFMAVLAGFAAFMLSVPDRSPGWALLPLPALLLWVVASSFSCMGTEMGDKQALGVQSPHACFFFIVAVSLPLSLLLLMLLRRAYSMRPKLTATMSGLAASGAAAALLEFEHPVDITVPDLFWHLAAVGVVVAGNRLLSGRLLRRAAIVLAVAFAPAASQADGSRPLVVELFTSQGCSSCPPADALLTEYARTRPDLLPLAFHVEYWNDLGWRDPFSFPGATERQRLHVSRIGDPTLYTPELVVEGAQGVIGSDRAAVDDAISRARTRQRTLAAVGIRPTAPGEVTVTIGAGSGQAAVILIGFDPSHLTPIGRGENSGRTLLESNIVRSVETVARWTGAPLELHHAAPAGEQAAVVLEAPDGRVVGAAYIPSARR